jgi:hypothetical protein
MAVSADLRASAQVLHSSLQFLHVRSSSTLAEIKSVVTEPLQQLAIFWDVGHEPAPQSVVALLIFVSDTMAKAGNFVVHWLQVPALFLPALHESPLHDLASEIGGVFAFASRQQCGAADLDAATFGLTEFFRQHGLSDSVTPSFGLAPVKADPRTATAENASAIETSLFMILSLTDWCVSGHEVCSTDCLTCLTHSQPLCRFILIGSECVWIQTTTKINPRDFLCRCAFRKFIKSRSLAKSHFRALSISLELRKFCSAPSRQTRTHCRPTLLQTVRMHLEKHSF